MDSKIPSASLKECASKLVKEIVFEITKNELSKKFVAGNNAIACLVIRIGIWNHDFELGKNHFEIVMKSKIAIVKIGGRNITGIDCSFWKGCSR